MYQITVSVKDFFDRAKEMLDDGMESVSISFHEADGEGEDYLPPCLWLEATDPNCPEAGIVYDEIEEYKP